MKRPIGIVLTALTLAWIGVAAFGRELLARAIPSLNGPFRTWPRLFAAIPLVLAIAAVAFCVAGGKPRAREEGWRGAAVVGVFLSSMSALAWAFILLAQLTPTS
ncbi:MAG: hypothetical protein ABR552_03640 [Actinomycetota bacterium]